MTTPDEIIAGLKVVIDVQGEVTVDLREHVQTLEADVQTLQADVEHWKAEAFAFEAEADAQSHARQMCMHIPWKTYDEIIRALEAGDAKHALRLLEREAQS